MIIKNLTYFVFYDINKSYATINKYHSNDLSHAVGKKGIMVFGLTDKGFKKAIMEELERGDHNEG